MARATMILVSDDETAIENGRSFARQQDFGFQSFSSLEWQRQGHSLDVLGKVDEIESNNVIHFPGPKRGATPDGRVKTMNQLESEAIENAIFEFNGNLTEAAKALGIGRATLYRKVKQYNIDPTPARRQRVA